MKFKSIIIATILSVAGFSLLSAAPKKIKEEINVSGNCGSCKSRIEKAAYSAGVATADWNSATQTLTVVYNPKRVDHKTIAQNILAVGHAVEGEQAADEVYNDLPGCCQYRDVAPHNMSNE